MQKKERKCNKTVMLASSFIVSILILMFSWNAFLIKEIKRSGREMAELKSNIEKVEILEKVNRNFIKDTLRHKAISLCFMDLIKDHEKKYTRKEKEDCIQLMVMTDEKYGQRGIDAPLILAWLEKESTGDPDSVSLYGAKGLTQWIDYRAWKILTDMGYPGYDAKLIMDPVINLAGGLYYLENLVNFWEWKGLSDQSPVLFYALYSYKWGAERTEVMFQKGDIGKGQDVQHVDWILNQRKKWADKLKYWIADGQKLTKEFQEKKMSSDG